MSPRLLLAIDEQWPARPDCPWVLLGPDGQPAAEGHSEPRHWPAAAESHRGTARLAAYVAVFVALVAALLLPFVIDAIRW